MTSESGGPAADRAADLPADTSVAGLDALPTERLRAAAFALAERRHDLAFFWDLVRHLPASGDVASEDGSPGNIGGSIGETVELVRELMRGGVGETEPLFRARFIDYLSRPG